MRRWIVALLLLTLAAACGPVPVGSDAGASSDGGPLPDAGASSDGGPLPDAGPSPDAGSQPLDAGPGADGGNVADAGPTSPDGGIDGVVFVHGINGSAADWDVMLGRFRDAGWPADRLVANTLSDPRWGCNPANAGEVSTWVQQLRARGAQRVAVVAHSMGGLSSRYYVKTLGGTAAVEVFTTLGTMHHGLSTPCLNPLPVCVWQELCESGSFIQGLDAPPATPGPTRWFSIYSDADTTVPMASSQLVGATNVLVPGLDHSGANGLQASPVVYQHVLDSFR